MNDTDNAEIEFHDSTLEELIVHEHGILLVLSVYVHRSKGKPGVAPGSGWSATAHIQISGARTAAGADSLPFELNDGTVTCGDTIFANVLPVPFASSEPVEICLTGFLGETFEGAGTGIEALLVGEQIYVEEFPGADPT